jgi:hypothetical protein
LIAGGEEEEGEEKGGWACHEGLRKGEGLAERRGLTKVI